MFLANYYDKQKTQHHSGMVLSTEPGVQLLPQFYLSLHYEIWGNNHPVYRGY